MRPAMEKIRLERWTSRSDDPNSLVYDGPRTGIEVFQTLRERLELIGMLPDGPLELDQYWADGKDIPRGADISCTADYGASRGTYLDVFLTWPDPETNNRVRKHFFDVRTSGETGADLDRMFLIGSAIIKAVHGDGGESARYPWLHPLDDGLVRTVSLTPKEQQLLIEALADRREMFIGEMDGTERLLRRMVGSITAYMDIAGGRPLHLGDYDKAALAIRDGELETFKELYPKAIDRADELLIEAAGRTGEIGRKMTICLLVDVKVFSNAAYLEASKRAVKTGDKQRVEFLMENEKNRVETHDKAYFGEVIECAEYHDLRMARELLEWSSKADIAAAPPKLMIRAIEDADYQILSLLLKGGIDTFDVAQSIFLLAYARNDKGMAKFLVENGMNVRSKDYQALDVCVSKGDIETSLLLLDRGMDFEGYEKWADETYGSGVQSAVMDAMREHWQGDHTVEVRTAPIRTSDSQRQKGNRHRREER